MNANDERYNIIISVIWGFGLASIFRKVCKGRKCIVVKKNKNNLDKGIYKRNNKCYKYEKNIEKCN